MRSHPPTGTSSNLLMLDSSESDSGPGPKGSDLRRNISLSQFETLHSYSTPFEAVTMETLNDREELMRLLGGGGPDTGSGLRDGTGGLSVGNGGWSLASSAPPLSVVGMATDGTNAVPYPVPPARTGNGESDSRVDGAPHGSRAGSSGGQSDASPCTSPRTYTDAASDMFGFTSYPGTSHTWQDDRAAEDEEDESSYIRQMTSEYGIPDPHGRAPPTTVLSANRSTFPEDGRRQTSLYGGLLHGMHAVSLDTPGGMHSGTSTNSSSSCESEGTEDYHPHTPGASAASFQTQTHNVGGDGGAARGSRQPTVVVQKRVDVDDTVAVDALKTGSVLGLYTDGKSWNSCRLTLTYCTFLLLPMKLVCFACLCDVPMWRKLIPILKRICFTKPCWKTVEDLGLSVSNLSEVLPNIDIAP